MKINLQWPLLLFTAALVILKLFGYIGSWIVVAIPYLVVLCLIGILFITSVLVGAKQKIKLFGKVIYPKR